MIIVSFRERLVFWFGLLYLNLPLDRLEPVPDKVGGDVEVEVALAVGMGPKRSLADLLGGDLGGATLGARRD